MRLRWMSSDLRDGIISGLVSGAVVSLVVLAVTFWFEDRVADNGSRLENVRFVRQVALTNGAPMPFRGLDVLGRDVGDTPAGSLT
jgi:hypothetical protein